MPMPCAYRRTIPTIEQGLIFPVAASRPVQVHAQPFQPIYIPSFPRRPMRRPACATRPSRSRSYGITAAKTRPRTVPTARKILACSCTSTKVVIALIGPRSRHASTVLGTK
ncbi:hypothetical protein BDU57DRAFT_533705 [Ampelomyces quisqualis]|uniref:Uncharacterized protein n=1 Tax=Ampelomyces quisqualis TaxID=50730 RepID=A0A6A5Q6I8_AMPQU|nr:hypothetical protein BDU57DRAFT_533705 [Ampelomyces quisqualis]